MAKQQNLWVNGEDSYISTVAERNKLQSYLVCFQHSAFSTHSTQISSLKLPQYTPSSLLLCCGPNTIFWAMAMKICCLNYAGEVGLWPFHYCTLRFIHWCCYAWLHGRPHWLSLPTELWGWPYGYFEYLFSTVSINQYLLTAITPCHLPYHVLVCVVHMVSHSIHCCCIVDYGRFHTLHDNDITWLLSFVLPGCSTAMWSLSYGVCNCAVNSFLPFHTIYT